MWNGGAAIDLNDSVVQGCAESIIGEDNRNTASQAVIVDLTGFGELQVTRTRTLVASESYVDKPVVYFTADGILP